MKRVLTSALVLVFTVLTLTACSSNPYGDPDGQRDRSKGAQDEMRRDTAK